MNVLFLTLSNMENVYERGIYTDLVRELSNRKINVYVVFPREKRTKLPTELNSTENIKLLKVKTGNITKTNFMEKGISTLTIEGYFLKAIKKYIADIRFDLIIYSTPPITFERVVKNLKKNYQCKTYLMLKDIFPQNAVDINLIKKDSLLWKYFRKKEKKLYKVSDKIGCMSKGNIDYILKHNAQIDDNKVELFPNSIKPIERIDRTRQEKKISAKYNIPSNSTLFVYGGNLGKPQGISFLLKVIDNFHKVKNSHLLIVGSGTEFDTIKNHLITYKPNNVSLLNNLPKDKYDQLLEMADVGLIFLDHRFTIPNFPSRLTAYMEYSIPIIAATDKNTDLKEILEESKCGLWSESTDIDSFIKHARSLSMDKESRIKMGFYGREYLEKHYDIQKNVNILTKYLQENDN